MKRTLNTGVKLSICPFITTLKASDFYAKIGVHFRCLFLLHQIDHVHYQCVFPSIQMCFTLFIWLSDRPCSSSEFQCGNGRCIHLNFYCDGIDHCDDSTDEIQCGNI
jgi:hypothetical protein